MALTHPGTASARPPMTMTEKMLARASALESCCAGDLIHPDPAIVIIHDGYIETAYKELSGIGYKRITNPERVAFITDHDVIYTSQRVAEKARANRRIAKEWRAGHFSDAGQNGHGHIFPMEIGMVEPGMFLIAYDMHCSTFGAIGAYALASGNETSVVLATGSLMTEVPRAFRIRLAGEFKPGVHARDLGFRLAHSFTSGERDLPYDSRVFEFTGPGARSMPVAARVALCNTLTEIGAAHVLFPPIRYTGEPIPELDWLEGDADANYEAEFELRLDTLTPQVALPGAPDNAAAIEDVTGRPIDHAYLGSCGSAMYEDFSAAAELMKGQTLAPGVRMAVVPGTTQIARRLADEGILQIFIDAGATVLPPGCGPCAGGRSGMLAAGEVSISTAATNSAGRMGAPTSEAYLGSPLTVAASAISGRITDPREVMETARDVLRDVSEQAGCNTGREVK